MTTDSKRSSIYTKAQNYLSRRAYGREELFKKLLEKFPENDNLIMEVLDECVRLGYINDELYIAQSIRNRLQYKHKSLATIKQELYKKGLDNSQELIEKLVPDVVELEHNALERTVEKKLRLLTSYPKEKKLQKLKESLYRKGFSIVAIDEILNTL